MQKKLFIILLFLASFEQVFASKGPPCSAYLTSLVEGVTKAQKATNPRDFSKFIDKDFAKKLEEYYNRNSPDLVFEESKKTLALLLADTENLVEPNLRKSYLFALQHYIDRGGRFVIDLQMNDFDLQADMVAVRNPAHEFIRIPLYLLLYIEMGVPNVKENLLRDLTHELRHSISDERTRRRLRRSGVVYEPDYVYIHIGIKDINQYIGYAYQLELEAISAQNRFVPQATNNTGDLNLYPQLQALQRLLNSFTYESTRELQLALSNVAYYDNLINSYMDNYILHLESSISQKTKAPSIKALVEKIQKETLSDERVLALALEDFDVNAKAIENRLNEELSHFLRQDIEDLISRRILRIRRAYYNLLQVNQ